MIVKSLLFVIICIFVFETFKNLYKQREEYFDNFNVDVHIKEPYSKYETRSNFANPTPDTTKTVTTPATPELLDIDNTINANCTAFKLAKGKLRIMSRSPNADMENINTQYYSEFAPLLYDKSRMYYGNPHYIIEEGKRRYLDDKKVLAKLKEKYDKETDPTKKLILADELNLYKWQTYMFKEKNDKGEQRDMPDITTDYYPEEIGLSRPWRERHSHLPDYSKMAVDKAYKSDVDKYNVGKYDNKFNKNLTLSV
jgi:hypothetical protein